MEKENKKILFVTRPLSPPWDEASKNLAYFLAKNISDFPIDIMTKDILPELPGNIHQNPVYTSSEISGFTFSQKMKALFFQWQRKNDFDIVHYFFTPTRLNTFLIKNFLKKSETKTVQTIATLREDLWSNCDLKNLIFSDAVATYSEYSKKKLEGLGFSNVTRIYPGIDLELYQSRQKDFGIMAHFGLDQDDFVITYPGEYTRLGATDDIVKAIPGIIEGIENAKFVFALRVKNEKDFEKKNEIMRILEEKGLSNRVIYTDTYPDMEKIYNMSDVIIFPVRDMKGKFDVPLAVIEPMACEKPVIVSDLPILQEFARSDNSITIEKGINSQLIEAILDLRQNPEKGRELGKQARRFVEENFDIKKVAQKYKEIYEKL